MTPRPRCNALHELLDYPGTEWSPWTWATLPPRGFILSSADQLAALDAGHVMSLAQRRGPPVVATQPRTRAIIDATIPTINPGRDLSADPTDGQ